MLVGLHSDYDLAAWARGGRAGQRPGIAPYGLDHLAKQNVEVRQLWPLWRTKLIGRAFRSVEGRIDFPLARTIASHSRTAAVDVALGVLENQGFPHAVMRRARIQPWATTPLALLTCWLAERARSATTGQLRRLRVLAAGADLFIFWSTNQEAIFRERLGIPPDRLFFVPFGVEDDFYRPASGADAKYILAVGRDRGRDYHTFINAIARVDFPVKIACPLDRLAGLNPPAHVECLGEVSHAKLRHLMSHAAVVVVSTQPEVAYPTGQTVLLSAMSCHRPTVVTATPALSDYLRPDENTCAVEPRDPEALGNGIARVLSDQAFARRIAAGGHSDVKRTYNSRLMWQTIGARLHDLVR